MGEDADRVADTVLQAFDKLPRKVVPRERFDGTREWVPLSGIVLSIGMPFPYAFLRRNSRTLRPIDKPTGVAYKCVSLG